MKSAPKLVRWLMVVLLGFVLGLGYVYWSLSPIKPQELAPIRHLAVAHAPLTPVRLSEDAIRGELIEVIQSQLAAFRKDDYPKAYYYAAATIREQVPLPSFERMVRNGFPVIARSSSVEFGVIMDNGEDAMVNAAVISQTGKLIRYRYFLHLERIGWKITGVVRVPFEDTFV